MTLPRMSSICRIMTRLDRLRTQARKCRMLANGLSNADDIRTLEQLACELEAEARVLESAVLLGDKGVSRSAPAASHVRP